MAGKMMEQNGIDDERYSGYKQAASMGGQHGMKPEMVDDFRSGGRTQQRRDRREKKGRYNSRPANHNDGKGKKSEESSRFNFFDSDTSSSSSSSDN